MQLDLLIKMLESQLACAASTLELIKAQSLTRIDIPDDPERLLQKMRAAVPPRRATAAPSPLPVEDIDEVTPANKIFGGVPSVEDYPPESQVVQPTNIGGPL